MLARVAHAVRGFSVVTAGQSRGRRGDSARLADGYRFAGGRLADGCGDEVGGSGYGLGDRRVRVGQCGGDLRVGLALQHLRVVGRAGDEVAAADVGERDPAGGLSRRAARRTWRTAPGRRATACPAGEVAVDDLVALRLLAGERHVVAGVARAVEGQGGGVREDVAGRGAVSPRLLNVPNRDSATTTGHRSAAQNGQ